ncbi:MAG: M61 family metallopeptidase [Cuniculiplasma sp.]
MKVGYILEMREPGNGFFQITMNIDSVSEDITMITMPAWTPGSYAIRDYSRNVRTLRAKTPENEPIEIQKKDKSTWKLINGNNKTFSVSYEVYAGEFSVRGSHLDTTHGYLNGTNVFMYVEGYKDQSVELIIKPQEDWKISTGMERIGENKFRATNYDIFADCPIEIGTHRSLLFTVDGKEHEIALYGSGNENTERLVEDFKKIVETTKSIFGSLPYRRYVFILHLTDRGSGGLEHLNSNTIDYSRFTFTDPKDYHSFLSVVSHEYFHLWNVKRIRPTELGPFNYKDENYTTLLWVSEGITNFYGNLILLRSGLISREEYFKHISEIIKGYSIQPGTRYESASDSSFDAWIKLYRESPNNINSYVSYYLKGEILGLMLNSRISEYTKGQKSLDDVFRHMMDKYNKDGRGFTEKDLLSTLSEVSSLDFGPFFARYVRGTDSIDFQNELQKIGLKLETKYSSQKNDKEITMPYIGILVKKDKFNVYAVLEDSPGQKSGIAPGDEIVAINSFRMDARFLKPLNERNETIFIDNFSDFKPGDRIRVQVFRRSILETFDVTLGEAPHDTYEIREIENVDENGKRTLEKFLMG